MDDFIKDTSQVVRQYQFIDLGHDGFYVDFARGLTPLTESVLLLSIPIPQDTILYTGFVKSNREVDFYAGIVALDCTPI